MVLRIMRIILRIMPKSSLSDVLFPKTRQNILAATYGQPERWWYLSELADWINTTPSSLQRELESLANGGILRKRREGNRVYFQAETDSPVFAPLKELVIQTLGMIPALNEAFLPFKDKINCAFIYGSVASGKENALSDVDVLVVGSAGLAELAPELRNLERKFKREFNVSCYRTEEFKEKLQMENHFLTKVLKEKKIFIVGDADDLDRLC